MFPGLTEAEQDQVIDAVRAAVDAISTPTVRRPGRRAERERRLDDDAWRPAGERELRRRPRRPRLDGPQPPPDPVIAAGRRLVAVADPVADALAGATAGTGAQGFAEPLAMIAEAELDARRHRRADHRPPAAGPRRDRTRRRRSSSRSRSPATVEEALRIVARGARARACPSRSATSSASTRPCSSSAGCSRRGWLSHGLRDRQPSRRPVPRPDPRRRRDRRPRHARRRHPVLDRRRAARRASSRRPPSGSTPTTRTCSSGCSTSRPARPAMLDVNWLTPAKRRQLVGRRRGGHVRARLPDPAPDVHAARTSTNPRLIGGYAPTFARRGRRAAGRQRASRSPPSSTRSSASSATAAGRSSTPRTGCGRSRSPRAS